MCNLTLLVCVAHTQQTPLLIQHKEEVTIKSFGKTKKNPKKPDMHEIQYIKPYLKEEVHSSWLQT